MNFRGVLSKYDSTHILLCQFPTPSLEYPPLLTGKVGSESFRKYNHRSTHTVIPAFDSFLTLKYFDIEKLDMELSSCDWDNMSEILRTGY